MDSKKCSACKEVLPISNFSKSGKDPMRNFRGKADAPQRYASRCKKCASEYAREWRARNPGYRKPNLRHKRDPQELLLESMMRTRMFDAKTRRPEGFSLDLEWAWAAWTGKCAISGIPLTTDKGCLDIGSIDRIDPNLPYTPENSQWVSWRVNRAKGEQGMEQFIDMCRAVLEGVTTIPEGSTPQADGGGSAKRPTGR